MEEQAGKNPLLSKTLWVNLLMAVAGFIPAVGDWIALNPESTVAIGGVINLILRFFTKEPLKVK